MALCLAASACAAGPQVNPKLLTGFWPAQWITAPGATPFGYGVYHFRQTVSLAAKPDRFVVHASADNRYRLFVNGEFVASGPAQSDLRNWRFETIDIAPRLKAGRNVLAAVVWNGSEFRPMAQISHRTGFILQGDTETEKSVNTDKTWRAFIDRAYGQITYRDNDPKLGYEYYVAGAMERVDGSQYPWGWDKPEFDDSGWPAAEQIDAGAPAGVESHQKWQLTPRPLPLLFERPEPPVRPSDQFPASIPPNSTRSILIDHGRTTTGYPVLRVTGGAGSQVRITYSEALYDANGRKGQRNDTSGKTIKGVHDIFLPDGGKGREFRPLWVRSFRWAQLDIKTGAEPLTVDSFEHFLTGYPAELKASFESDNSDLNRIFATGWRTLALGAQDVLVSDLYWERISYVGDTQIHGLAFTAMTGDDRLYRQAIEHFDASRAPFGLTQSRYPAELEQFTPLYALVWINMVHDYWMHRDDESFVRRFLPGIGQVVGWYERQMRPDGMLGPLFHLDFVDSNYGRRWQELKTEGAGTAIHTLYYSWALEHAAELYAHFGLSAEAERWRERASKLRSVVRERCWDAGRQLFADSPSKRYFSQQVNILAVLAGAVQPAEGRELLHRALATPDVLPVDLYFKYFLGRALRKSGAGGDYPEVAAAWAAMLNAGMTSFGEALLNPRSECHPWSASPNYELLATVAGIEPASPGFRTVRIEPAPGPLRRLHAVYPHPLGSIQVDYERQGDKGLKAKVSLPPGLKGSLVWNGQKREIAGAESLTLP